MKRADRVDTRASFPEDAVDALVALADEAGAKAIATDARRVADRLDATRLHVSVVSEHLLSLRSGPGIRFAVGTPASRWPPGRTDLFIIDDANASGLQRIDGTRGAETYAVNLRRRDAIRSLVELVDRTARYVGADRVEEQAAEHYRGLCRQLWQHFSELQRALAATSDDARGRVNALALVGALAESVFESRAERSEADRDALTGWLATERRKFLMATRADAMLALHERIARMAEPSDELRRSTSAAAQQIAVELLASFWQRLRGHADTRLSLLAKRLLDDVNQSLGDLLETTPLDALARIGPIRRFQRDIEVPFSTGLLESIADRIGLGSRRKIERAAHEELLVRLEMGASRLTARVLDDHDERTTAVEHRLFDLLDAAVESIEVAAERASNARLAGSTAVAEARSRIGAWSATLNDIYDRLE